MHIAILGGSFDPPHIGHYLVASQVLEYTKVDKVWLMPDYSHPFEKKLSSVAHRLAMTRLLTQKPNIEVSDYAVSRKKTSFTYDILNELETRYPHDQFSFIIGSDNLKTFRKWTDWKSLVKEKSIIVFPRDTHLRFLSDRVKDAFGLKIIPKNISVIDAQGLIVTNISSTHIRMQLSRRKPIHFEVPEKVEKYIKKHGLYKHET